jgi:hypothetical protein
MIIRENGRQRQPRDFYPTPAGFCRAALQHCGILNEGPARPWHVLDAGAGAGAWGLALRQARPDCYLVGVDLPGIPAPAVYDAWHTDFFEVWAASYRGDPFDLVIGNPPYGSDAPEKWLRLIWGLLTPEGRVFWLLRLNWYSSQGRYNRLFQAGYHPAAIFQSAARLSFTGDGRTDDTDYAMYLWRRNWTQPYGQISMFDWRATEESGQLGLFEEAAR